MKYLYNKLKQINYYNHVTEWFPLCEKLFINSNIRSQGNCILISQFDGIGDAVLVLKGRGVEVDGRRAVQVDISELFQGLFQGVLRIDRGHRVVIDPGIVFFAG